MRSPTTAAATVRAALCLLALCALSACAGSSGGSHSQSANRYAGSPAGRYHVRNNTPPGPAEDPWGPYIKEASARFGMPEKWIRQVMRVESGGRASVNGVPTTSPVGAMGLMQVMPGTFGDLKLRYNLGDDPYDPHDNIMGGTAYLREMYDRFGSPNFLAAYNAGPHRVDQYLAGIADLPAETVRYVAMISPNLDGAVVEVAAADGPDPSDPNVIYAAQTGIGGPISPVPAVQAPVVQAAVVQAAVVQAAVFQAPVVQPVVTRPAPVQVASLPPPLVSTSVPARLAAPAPRPDLAPIIAAMAAEPAPRPQAPTPIASYQAASYTPAPERFSSAGTASVLGLVQAAQRQAPASSPPALPQARPEPRLVLVQSPRPPLPPGAWPTASGGGHLQLASSEVSGVGQRGGEGWAIQVGAYTTTAQASAAAIAARNAGGPLLRSAAPSVGVATRPDGSVLYRARLAGLSADTAEKACGVLSGRQIACASVPPA